MAFSISNVIKVYFNLNATVVNEIVTTQYITISDNSTSDNSTSNSSDEYDEEISAIKAKMDNLKNQI